MLFSTRHSLETKNEDVTEKFLFNFRTRPLGFGKCKRNHTQILLAICKLKIFLPEISQMFRDQKVPKRTHHHFCQNFKLNVRARLLMLDKFKQFLPYKLLHLPFWISFLDVDEYFWVLVTEFRYWWHLLNVGVQSLCQNF